MQEFFNMGGYAAYVWPCWLLTAWVLVINVVQPIRKHNKLKQQLKILAQRPAKTL